MVADFEPKTGELKQWIARIARSEKRFERWREEYRRYATMYANDPWERFNRPEGEAQMVRRNGVHANVYRDIRRLSVKDAVFRASPRISKIEREGAVLDGPSCAYAQSEAASWLFSEIGFEDTLPLALEDAGIANEGWVKVITKQTADQNETEVWVDDEDEGSGESHTAKRVKPRSVACGPLGVGVIWADVDDVITDADAVTKNEISYVAHRMKKPLDNMRYEQIEDYDVGLDDDDRIIYIPKTQPKKDDAGQPVMELNQKTGQMEPVMEPVMVQKYDVKGLTGNYPWYVDQQRTKLGKNFREEDFNTDYERQDYLVWYEVNGRFPANSEVVKKKFGRVPKTTDGWVYYLMGVVEQTGEGMEAPAQLYWRWYPVDICGFALKKIKMMPKAGSQKGYSRVRNYWEALYWENYWHSYRQRYQEAVIPQTFCEESVVNAETVKKSFRESGIFGWIFTKLTGGRPMRDAIYTTTFPDQSPVIDGIMGQMRQMQDEAAGQSAGQRLQSTGGTATGDQIIQQNADEQLAFDLGIVKRFCEEVCRSAMLLWRSQLPKSGRVEIPGSSGFVQFDVMQFDVLCAYQLSYLSFPMSFTPVERKQYQEFIADVKSTPQNLWPMMKPFWRVQASSFSPALRAAYLEFEQVAFGQKSESDPDIVEHLLREGVQVDPDPQQDLVQNIPKLDAMLKRVTDDKATFGLWWQPVPEKVMGQGGQPQPTGKQIEPARCLIGYISKCKDFAMAKGLGPQLGLMGDKAGQSRKPRGGGQTVSPENPSSAEIQSGAESMNMVEAGTGMGA